MSRMIVPMHRFVMSISEDGHGWIRIVSDKSRFPSIGIRPRSRFGVFYFCDWLEMFFFQVAYTSLTGRTSTSVWEI